MTITSAAVKTWLLSSTVAFTCFAAPAAVAGPIEDRKSVV